MSAAGRSADPPLNGVRVLDLSRVLAGPFATQQLADLGAQVIKVEEPTEGDSTRSWGPPFTADGRSAYFLSCNRGKRSIGIDLRSSDGQEVCRRLALASDVLIENFRPGQLSKWGLELDALRRRNPRLVTCSITGFGPDGPRRDEGGYDALVQAMTGLMAITGPEEGPASKTGVAIVDLATGLFAATSIIALLHGRRAGAAAARHVDVSLYGSALGILANVGASALLTGKEADRHGNAHPTIVPYQVFSARDRDLFVAVGSDRQWQALARAVDRPEWLEVEPWATNPGRVQDRDRLVSVLAGEFGNWSCDELEERLRAARVPVGPVRGVCEALADPVVDARGFIVDHGDGTRSIRSPLEVVALPELGPAPGLGEHGREILTELGYPPGQQDRLFRSGAVRPSD